MMNESRKDATGWIRGGALVTAVLLAGCAATSPASTSSAAGSGTGVTASDPTRMTQSGFLSDYKRLSARALERRHPVLARHGRRHTRKYDKVLIARMVVTLKDTEGKGVDPTDLKALTDYFHASLAKALKPQMPVVDQPGAGVVVIRIALTDLVPTDVARSATGTMIPFGFVAEAGSGAASGRPAGSTPYLGQTGMEMQFRDGATDAILAECRDTEIGRKYAADMDEGAAGAAPDLGERLRELLPVLVVREERLRQVVGAHREALRRAAGREPRGKMTLDRLAAERSEATNRRG